MTASCIQKLNQCKGRALRLLLVYPRFPNSFWGFQYVGRFFRKPGGMPPLGLLTIAGMCPADWEILLIDENVEDLTDEHLAWADLVGVSSMMMQFGRAIQVIRRARLRDKPVIIGGAHVTCEPEVYADEADILIRNEGEITFRQFLEDYRNGTVHSRYETEEFADLSTTPLLRYDLLRRPRRYTIHTVQYGRGCPYECEFCSVVSMFGRRMRFRKVADVIRDIDSIRKTGYSGPLFIADDNLSVRKRKAIELCDALAEWNVEHGYPFFYAMQTSIESIADDELLRAYEKARFESAFIGIETYSDEALELSGKQNNVGRDLLAEIRRIQSHGIRVDAGIMVGFDTDETDIFDRQIRFIHDIAATVVQASIVSAIPSTPLHRRMQAEGRLLFPQTPLSVADGFGIHNPIGIPNSVPKNMSNRLLLEGYAHLIANIYSPDQYFDRALRQIATLKPDHRNRKLTLRTIFFSFPAWSVFIIIVCHFRLQYLRAALIALFRYPTKLREFKDLALRGIHYIELARRDVVPRALEEARKFGNCPDTKTETAA